MYPCSSLDKLLVLGEQQVPDVHRSYLRYSSWLDDLA